MDETSYTTGILRVFKSARQNKKMESAIVTILQEHGLASRVRFTMRLIWQLEIMLTESVSTEEARKEITWALQRQIPTTEHIGWYIEAYKKIDLTFTARPPENLPQIASYIFTEFVSR